MFNLLGEKFTILAHICEVYRYDFTYTEDGKIIMKSDEYGNLLKYENIDETLLDWEYTLMCSDSDNDDDYWLYERAFISIYLIRQITEMSFPGIAKVFNRDHTTIISSCEQISKKINTDPMFNVEISELIKEVSTNM